jgi:hypothetical protein
MIWNSDQGSHFTSPQYTDKLLAAGVYGFFKKGNLR